MRLFLASSNYLYIEVAAIMVGVIAITNEVTTIIGRTNYPSFSWLSILKCSKSQTALVTISTNSVIKRKKIWEKLLRS